VYPVNGLAAHGGMIADSGSLFSFFKSLTRLRATFVSSEESLLESLLEECGLRDDAFDSTSSSCVFSFRVLAMMASCDMLSSSE
jgi:hypothetical protein